MPVPEKGKHLQTPFNCAFVSVSAAAVLFHSFVAIILIAVLSV